MTAADASPPRAGAEEAGGSARAHRPDDAGGSAGQAPQRPVAHRPVAHRPAAQPPAAQPPVAQPPVAQPPVAQRRRIPVLAGIRYLVTTFLSTTVAFVAVVTLVSLGMSLGITPLAVPLMIVAFLAARLFADAERRRVASVVGAPIPRPRYERVTGWWWPRLKAMLKNPATYRDVTFAGLAMAVSIVTFTILVTFWATALGLVTYPLWIWSVPGGSLLLPDDATGWHIFGTVLFEGGWRVRTPLQALPLVPVGLLLIPVSRWVTRDLVRKQVAFTRALLSPGRVELAERVETLTVTRADAVAAQAAELRRIERDLHDGAQARLVTLAMELGLAREKLDADPQAARELLGEAHEEAKRALAELRDLARGIAPAVLSDRGLVAALAALAGRCPVPVRLDTDDLTSAIAAADADGGGKGGSGTVAAGRLPVDVETAAYFVVSEALTNVAKHSAAGSVVVHAALAHRPPGRPGDAGNSGPGGHAGGHSGSAGSRSGRAGHSPGPDLIVTISDDGVGGADESRGSGLAGLAARVRAVDGTLEVTSPPGGPTTLRAVIPCHTPG